ncbi:MAG: glycosyltransferase, partial [Chloroflexi bacterium]|nr:glycosyltransferase [Chloroflexota bacterium]
LKITGSTQGVALNGLALDDQVELTGYLPNVHEAVASALACVVPLRIGGGTRLKILEAMALGTPVVSTPKGAEGLAVTHEEHLLIADEPQTFAREAVRLLREPALRNHLKTNARRLVERHYNWNTIGAAFNDLVHSVVDSRSMKRPWRVMP